MLTSFFKLQIASHLPKKCREIKESRSWGSQSARTRQEEPIHPTNDPRDNGDSWRINYQTYYTTTTTFKNDGA